VKKNTKECVLFRLKYKEEQVSTLPNFQNISM